MTSAPERGQYDMPGGLSVESGTGALVLARPVGTIYIRKDGGSSSTLYVKESGGSSTSGWVAK